MTRTATTLLVICSAASLAFGQGGNSASPQSGPAPRGGASMATPAAPAGRESIGFTWWNDVPEMIRRGNDQLLGESPDTAGEYYQDALVRDAREPVAAMNLGLARAQKQEFEQAASAFSRALELAGENAAIRERALYNLGVARMNQAIAAEKNRQREEAIARAVEALDAFNGALNLNPGNQDAEFNKSQSQHFLRYFSTPSPTPTPTPQQSQDQQQQQQQQDGGGSSSQDQQQQDQQQQNQQQQDQQQQPQQDGEQNQQNPQQQDQQQPSEQDQQSQREQDRPQENEQSEQEQDQNQQEQQQQGGQGNNNQAQGRPQEMTPEQARQLLNLIGDPKNIVLRKQNYSLDRPKPEKDW